MLLANVNVEKSFVDTKIMGGRKSTSFPELYLYFEQMIRTLMLLLYGAWWLMESRCWPFILKHNSVIALDTCLIACVPEVIANRQFDIQFIHLIQYRWGRLIYLPIDWILCSCQFYWISVTFRNVQRSTLPWQNGLCLLIFLVLFSSFWFMQFW